MEVEQDRLRNQRVEEGEGLSRQKQIWSVRSLQETVQDDLQVDGSVVGQLHPVATLPTSLCKFIHSFDKHRDYLNAYMLGFKGAC